MRPRTISTGIARVTCGLLSSLVLGAGCEAGPVEPPGEPQPLPLPGGLSGTIAYVVVETGTLRTIDLRSGQRDSIGGVGLVGSLDWVPGNRELVFTRPYISGDCGPWSCDLQTDSLRPWRIGADGSGLAALAPCAPGRLVEAAFRGDGMMACKGSGAPGVYGVYLAGQPLYESARIYYGQCGFTWSPDGSFIVVPHSGPDGVGGVGLYRITLADTSVTAILPGNNDILCHPTFSPSGTRLAYEERLSRRIWVAEADGSHPRVLTAGQNDSDPEWSPDGQWLAFRRWGELAGIWLVRADGTDETQILRGGAFHPAWSP